MKVCAVVDCGSRVTAKGHCNRHYQRLRRHGDPLGGSEAAPLRAFGAEDRALALVSRNQRRTEDQQVLADVGFLVGESVLCRREAPSAGTWRRFNGRRGVVAAFTIDRSGPEPYVEVGVAFTGSNYPDAWFLPNELEAA